MASEGPLDAGLLTQTLPPTCPFANERGSQSWIGPPHGSARTSHFMSGETEAERIDVTRAWSREITLFPSVLRFFSARLRGECKMGISTGKAR